MKIMDAWIDEPMPLVVCTAHIFQPYGDAFRCVRCGRMAEDT